MSLSPSNRIHSWILAFFFVSGLSALIYEIVWMKMLVLVIGNTVYSTTTVLASFMGGLAAGSFAAGKLLHKLENPFKAYGILEGLIGIYALGTPFLIDATEPLFRWVYQNGSPQTFGLARIVVCGAILIVPTTLMGATLPLLSDYLARKETELGWTVGKLYGLNTLGAVFGAAGAGFLLIPSLGISWALRMAAMLNIAIAGAVFVLARKKAVSKPKVKKSKKKKTSAPEPEWTPDLGSLTLAGVMIAIGLAGTASMIYQIAWTRVLSLIIGSSVYAFSLIVSAFICGLALGPLVVGKLIDRSRNLILGLALLEVAVGLSALATLPALGRLPAFIAQTLLESSYTFRQLHTMEFGIIFFLVLVPTFMMGAAFPIAAKICAAGVERFGTSVGNVYAANTLGAIGGTLIGGFFLIPRFGTQNAVFFAVMANLAAAALVLLTAPRFTLKRIAIALGAVGITLLVWLRIPGWDPLLLTSSPYLYPERYRELSETMNIGIEEAMKEGRELLYLKEGLHATISVDKTGTGDIVLQVNGKADASARGDSATQLLLGHLPLLLHPSPEDILVIGLGSGLTLGAVELHPVDSIDVVEIEPAVVEASDLFRTFNRNALDDPRARLLVTDGRIHLTHTDRLYDVIISEPSNPWVAGMANLFTREFFDLSKESLRPGGLMCQWLHAYSISPNDFQTIVATFQSVFPNMSLWEVKLGGDYILIGSQESPAIDYPTLSRRLASVDMDSDLKTMNIRDVPSLLARLIMEEQSVQAYTRNALIHTDDNSLLEYSAPKTLLESVQVELLEDIYRYRSHHDVILKSLGWREQTDDVSNILRVLSESRQEVLNGYLYFLQENGEDAVASFERGLSLNPKDVEAVGLLRDIYYETGNRYRSDNHPEQARLAFQKSVDVITDYFGDDRELLQHQFDLSLGYADALVRLAWMALDDDDLEGAKEALEESLLGGVEHVEAHNSLGMVHERAGDLDQALKEYQRALEMKPRHFSALINCAGLHLKQGQLEEAITRYLQAQTLRPEFEMVYYNLGVAYYRQGKWTMAANEWERALELRPDFAEARRSLETIREKISSNDQRN